MTNPIIPATYPATHFVEANPPPDWIALMAIFFALFVLSIGLGVFYGSMNRRRAKAITRRSSLRSSFSLQAPWVQSSTRALTQGIPRMWTADEIPRNTDSALAPHGGVRPRESRRLVETRAPFWPYSTPPFRSLTD